MVNKRAKRNGVAVLCPWCKKRVQPRSDYFLTFVSLNAMAFHPVCYSRKAKTGNYYWIYTPKLTYASLGLFAVGSFLSGISLAAMEINPSAVWFLLFGLIFIGLAIYQLVGLEQAKKIKKILG